MTQLSLPSLETEPIDSRATTSSAEEVAALAWAVIDGAASVADRRRLSDLLTQEQDLRWRYVQAIQMNSQLQRLFARGAAPAVVPCG